jgi:hypothetical protein
MGKAEVARTELPALVRVEVPHSELPREKLRQIEETSEILGAAHKGVEILLLPDVATRYTVRIELVEPCTCWRDGRPCDVCRDFGRQPGGWNGTFL